MEKENIINYIINCLNNGEDEYEIERYLKIKDVNPGEFTGLFDIAKEKILSEKLVTYPKKNKISFAVWTSISIFLFVLFFFILPSLNITRSIILSIIGAVCLCFTSFYAMVYYKSWKEDFIRKIGKPKPNLSIFLALAAIPTVVLYFIIDWRFSSKADSILRDTQEDAVATVIGGKSVEGRRINFAEIRVRFETKEGVEVEAVEDVTTYKFKEFYEGQVINIVYSKDNPLNIDLLIDEDNIRNLKNTQEREIEPNDLLNLISAKEEKITTTLNKISFGWVYNSEKSSWINEKRQNMIMKNNNILTFFSNKMEYNYTYPKKFKKLGFKKTSVDDPQDRFGIGEQILENDKYIVNIKSVVLNNTPNSVIIIEVK